LAIFVPSSDVDDRPRSTPLCGWDEVRQPTRSSVVVEKPLDAT